jgi:hypothetical protein
MKQRHHVVKNEPSHLALEYSLAFLFNCVSALTQNASEIMSVDGGLVATARQLWRGDSV